MRKEYNRHPRGTKEPRWTKPAPFHVFCGIFHQNLDWVVRKAWGAFIKAGAFIQHYTVTFPSMMASWKQYECRLFYQVKTWITKLLTWNESSASSGFANDLSALAVNTGWVRHTTSTDLWIPSIRQMTTENSLISSKSNQVSHVFSICCWPWCGKCNRWCQQWILHLLQLHQSRDRLGMGTYLMVCIKSAVYTKNIRLACPWSLHIC